MPDGMTARNGYKLLGSVRARKSRLRTGAPVGGSNSKLGDAGAFDPSSPPTIKIEPFAL